MEKLNKIKKIHKILSMISTELIDLFESVVSGFNSKQQIIARELVLDSTIQIFKLEQPTGPQLYIRDAKLGGRMELEKYVKLKCNC